MRTIEEIRLEISNYDLLHEGTSVDELIDLLHELIEAQEHEIVELKRQLRFLKRMTEKLSEGSQENG